MSTLNSIHSTVAATAAGPRRSPPPAWLERLWAQQNVPLSKEKLYWWSVQVQGFLAFVRREQVEGPVEVLMERFLEDLRLSQPPVPPWRQVQARQALEVFARGIEHWHFEREESGQLRVGFRVKSGSGPVLAGGGTDGMTNRTDGTNGADGRNGTEARGWRERMVATLRLRNYSLRTEEAYREWVERFLKYHSASEPEHLGETEVREFLEYLAVARNVSASTQNPKGSFERSAAMIQSTARV